MAVIVPAYLFSCPFFLLPQMRLIVKYCGAQACTQKCSRAHIRHNPVNQFLLVVPPYMYCVFSVSAHTVYQFKNIWIEPVVKEVFGSLIRQSFADTT